MTGREKPTSVSEHLKVLRDCGLVAEDKRGRFRHYRVNPEPLQEISAWLSPYERFWRGRGTRVVLRHNGFDSDDDLQQRSRTIMRKGWARIAAQLGELLDG